MFTPSLEEIKQKLQSTHNYFPVALPYEMDHTYWFSIYKQVSSKSNYHTLLESGRAGRYSYLLYHPAYSFRAKAGEVSIQLLDESGYVVQENKEQEKHALLSLQTWLAARQAPRFAELPDFQGGLVGFFSYDLIRKWERLPEQSKDDLATPDLYLVGYEQVLAYDHEMNQHWLIVYQQVEQGNIDESYQRARHRLSAWADELQAIVQHIQSTSEESSAYSDHQAKDRMKLALTNREAPDDLHASFSKDSFEEAVGYVQDYLQAGDVFQVNLSVRQEAKLEAEPTHIYEALREINPSPYMGYLHYPELQVISGSPEQLVKVRGNKVSTRPIGGTRPRGKSLVEDRLLVKELLANEKEQAEHVTLVDLVRNDLSKVCSYGSVQVNELMVIEEYSHVMHLVSNVVGELSEKINPLEVVTAVFPGGTITGAPKVRTMEIIEELEPVRRGIYTGSIGWIGYTGDLELNIVIRTMIVQAGRVYVQAGAGIVSESVPSREYEECLKKAEALWAAYALAKQRLRVN